MICLKVSLLHRKKKFTIKKFTVNITEYCRADNFPSLFELKELSSGSKIKGNLSTYSSSLEIEYNPISRSVYPHFWLSELGALRVRINLFLF